MKYYLRDEVVIHNRSDDIWIIIHGKVLDLTKLLKDRKDSDTMNDVSTIFDCLIYPNIIISFFRVSTS
jgi:hypothetical protein